jgi:uncharacterized protein (UPF0297 family)
MTRSERYYHVTVLLKSHPASEALKFELLKYDTHDNKYDIRKVIEEIYAEMDERGFLYIHDSLVTGAIVFKDDISSVIVTEEIDQMKRNKFETTYCEALDQKIASYDEIAFR